MRTYLDCFPCFIRQALEAARNASDDVSIHEQVIRKVLMAAVDVPLTMTPPAMGQKIHRLVREFTGQPDPYAEVKERFNRIALDMYPQLEERVKESADSIEVAIRLAIAGNLIDSGVSGDIAHLSVKQLVEDALTDELQFSVWEFCEDVERADSILYLADNAGEIVFDRLLIEQLPTQRITLAVRGAPAINDATRADAAFAGLDQIVNVIDNGSDAPGTLLDDCSDEFIEYFEKADLIISKGQGNYESLSGNRKPIYYLLKAKCPVVARNLRTDLGRMVALRPEDGPQTNQNADEMEVEYA